MAFAKLTVTHKIAYSGVGGDSIVLQGQETLNQTGNDVSSRTQAFTSTTTAVNIGGCTGSKYFGVKNLVDPKDSAGAPLSQAALDNATIYVDIVTPVVPSAAQFKLPPGKAMLIFTSQDTWYAITGSAGATAIVGAVEL